MADTSHGLITGDTANFSSGTAIGTSGITLSGDYLVTVTNANSYTVQASSNAATTQSSLGSATYKYEISVGRTDSQNAVGYGTWLYGSSTYGTPRPQLASTGLLEASTWALDNWGEYLIACRSDEGKIYEIAATNSSSGKVDTIFVEDEAPFLEALRQSKKLIVEMEFYQEGSKQFVFNTAGLKW